MNSTPHPHIVIDVNCLRNDQAIRQAVAKCREENLALLIPDGVGYEIGRVIHRGAEKIQASLEHFKTCLDVFSISKKLSNLIRAELEHRQTVSSLVDDSLTHAFIEIINAGHGWENIQENLDRLMPVSVDVWNNTDKLLSIDSIVDQLLSFKGIDSLEKRLRHNDANVREAASIELLSSGAGIEYVRNCLSAKGFQDTEIDAFFATANSIAIAFAIGLAALAVRFRFQTPKNDDIPNSFHDLEYAIYGAISQGRLLTNDVGQKSLMRTLIAVQGSFASKP